MCANILTHLACSAPSLVGVIDSRSRAAAQCLLENEGLASCSFGTRHHHFRLHISR